MARLRTTPHIASARQAARGDETKTRRRIVKLLKTEGAMDSASLAGRLHVTAMAVRQHLYALQQEKLVSAEERRVPLGRPAKFWRLTKDAERLFPDAYAELNAALITSVQDAFGPEGMARLLDARVARQRADYRSRINAIGASVEESAAARADPRRRRVHGRGEARRPGVSFHRESLPDLRRRHRLPGLLRQRARPLPLRAGARRQRRAGGTYSFGRPALCLPNRARAGRIRRTEAL